MRCCYLHGFFPRVLLGWDGQYHLKWSLLQLPLKKFCLFKYISVSFFFTIVSEPLQLKLFFLLPFIALKSLWHGDWPLC